MKEKFIDKDNDSLFQQENISFIANTGVRKLSYKMRFWRWVILGLIAVFLLTNTMSSSVLGSLQEQIIEALDTDYDGYNMLSASFALPNIINPFVAGIIIDIIGRRLGLIGYSSLIVIGMILQYIATTLGSYNWMVAGIISYSIGTASMAIIIPLFISIWFIGKQLSLGLGTIACASNLGVVLANLTLPPLYQKYQTVTIPYLVCVIVTCVGYLSLYGIFGIDYKSEKDDNKREQVLQQQEENNKNDLDQEQNSEIENETLKENDQQKNEEEKVDKKQNKMSLKDFKQLKNIMYWLIVNIGLFQNVAIFFLSSNLQHILIKFYGLDEVDVGRIVSVTTLAASLLGPLYAHITDKIGRRAECFVISSTVQCITLILWMFIPVCQEGGCYWFYLPIIINACGASITAAAYYPSVTLVVDSKVLGSAFGFSDCIKSLGIFLTPFVFGPVMKYGQKPEVNSYFWLYALSLAMSIFALCFSVLILIYDKKTGNRLNSKQGEYQQVSQNQKQKQNDTQETYDSDETNDTPIQTKISMTIFE